MSLNTVNAPENCDCPRKREISQKQMYQQTGGSPEFAKSRKKGKIPRK